MDAVRRAAGVAIFMLVGVLGSAEGATIDASSCSRADVGAAVSAAKPGDTVRVPAGTCTWTSKLQVNMGITLSGAGADSTILLDGIPRTNSNGRMIEVTIPTGQFFRLTGFQFRYDGVQSAVYDGTIILSGCSTTTANYRIDHNKFDRLANYGIRTWGNLYGLVDNNVGVSNKNRPLVHVTNANFPVNGVCTNDGQRGDTSWAQPTTLGTIQAHYIENNTWTTEGAQYVMVDSIAGARVVVRYNTLYNTSVGSHGTETGGRQRGVRQMEVYNNTFVAPSGVPVDSLIWFRSGTGVAFNNKITADVKAGLNAVVKTTNLRDQNSYSPWGKCDGTSPYDGNVAGESGYRCIDQPGAGTSVDYKGQDPPPVMPAKNALDPIYIWNNTVNGTANNCGTYGCMSGNHVRVDRDIVFSPRPGYTPFTFPHPSAGSGALAAPSNLNVR
jgi:hypothetical protein